ncbi:MAG: MASE1 domain-containing protein [Almyronema sp.]
MLKRAVAVRYNTNQMLSQKFSVVPRRLRQVGAIAVLAIAYYVMAEVSRYLASTPQDVTPVWPPDGIAVGAVLLFGNWISYGVLLGSFLANFWAFRDPTSFLSLIISTLPVLGIAVGTTLGTLLSAYLLRKSTKLRYPLEQVVDVFKFLILAGMVGPTVNATVGVTCLALSGKVGWSAYGMVWVTWWISNVSGIFIVTPVMLSWGQLIRTNRNRPQKWLPWPSVLEPFAQLPENSNWSRLGRWQFWPVVESLLLVGLVIFAGRVAFTAGHRLEYVLIPILLWSAFRLGQPGATLLSFIVAAIAVIATVNGKGGFASADLNQSLTQLQSFIGVVTLTVLVVTATMTERAQAEDKLRLAFAELARTNETLETRVHQRTEELHEKNAVLEQTLRTLRQTQLQMLQSEKMSALGQMVAGIAHEINNPVGFIYGNLIHISKYSKSLLKIIRSYQQQYPHPPQALQKELDELEIDFLAEDLLKTVQSMQIGTERIQAIVLSLRNFSRLDEAELKVVDIREGIDSTLVILQHRLKATADRPEIEVFKEYGQLPLVECYAGFLNQVFMNILSNAIDALEEANQERTFQELMAKPNTIWIKATQTQKDTVTIAISDNGVGIPEEIRSKLFDPFFTTKPVGQGTGLGLSVCYQIVVEKHQGKLWCDSTPTRGTSFFIELPIHARKVS